MLVVGEDRLTGGEPFKLDIEIAGFLAHLITLELISLTKSNLQNASDSCTTVQFTNVAKVASRDHNL